MGMNRGFGMKIWSSILVILKRRFRLKIIWRFSLIMDFFWGLWDRYKHE